MSNSYVEKLRSIAVVGEEQKRTNRWYRNPTPRNVDEAVAEERARPGSTGESIYNAGLKVVVGSNSQRAYAKNMERLAHATTKARALPKGVSVKERKVTAGEAMRLRQKAAAGKAVKGKSK